MSSSRLVVIGKLVVDEIIHCAHTPHPGTSQHAVSRSVTGGGQVWHTARAASRLGTPVTVTGWCGQDSDSNRLREQLAALGIEDRLVVAGDAVRALVIVDKDGERAIISHSGSGHLTTSMLDIDATLENAGALHIDGYALDSASAQAVIAVAAEAVERGIRVSMEPPSVLHLEKVLPALRRLPALDAVLGRPDELAACAGSLRTPQAVTVTHAGPGDVAVHEGRERVLVPVPAPVGALHATGAGTGSLRGG